jgi:hypothetical protein
MKEREQSLATKLANIQDLVTTMEKQTEHGFQVCYHHNLISEGSRVGWDVLCCLLDVVN